jgi:hypothetical protein
VQHCTAPPPAAAAAAGPGEVRGTVLVAQQGGSLGCSLQHCAQDSARLAVMQSHGALKAPQPAPPAAAAAAAALQLSTAAGWQ